MERRKLKFSEESLQRIRSDPLKNVGLLSRSNVDSIQELQQSQEERENLLLRLKHEESIERVTHGLRKLREVIISVFDNNKKDERFLRLVEETYLMSYENYLRKGDIYAIGGIVLEFIVEKLPEFAKENQIVELHIIYLSHFDNNLEKCLQSIRKYNPKEKGELLNMSLLHCRNNSSLHYWFQDLIVIQKKQKLTFELLHKSGKIKEMQLRCLLSLQMSYNQLSWEYFQSFWLASIPADPLVFSKAKVDYNLTETSNGSKIMYFKQRSLKKI